MEITKKRISQIQRGKYGEWFNSKEVSTEPTREVLDAIARGAFESIAFQDMGNLRKRFAPSQGMN